MEDNKKNELKETLSKTYSQEDIENRLKQKIQTASQNRERFTKNRITLRNTLPKKELNFQKFNLNFLLLILLIIMGFLIFVTIYLFNKDAKKSVLINEDKKEKSYFTELYNSKNYDTFTCYSFKDVKISFPIKECKTKLDEFLTKNKNANRFEIVPIISTNDSIIYKSIEKDLSVQPEDLKKKIAEYLNIGLSNERVLESVWYIKKSLGEATIVTSSLYYVKSEKENEQGVIIRAYH